MTIRSLDLEPNIARTFTLNTARPFLVVYVLWHPNFQEGAGIAEGLRKHFRRELYENVAGGTGLSVIFRSESASNGDRPIPMQLEDAETTAIIILAESNLVSAPGWLSYIRELSEQTEKAGFGTRIFPVSLETSVLSNLGVAEQALRWDTWDGGPDELRRRLTFELAYEFCRMLRYYLEHLKHPEEDQGGLEGYLKKVQIFLSHSKHDDDGERIARLIRDRLHDGHGLGSFFDVHDIPAGLRFHKVLLQQIKVSAMVAVHTDTYSSREWCRREIIEAKRCNVPLVVANCISNLDERGFPYMGNVPVIRLESDNTNRIDIVVGRLLDEILKDFLWRCRIMVFRMVNNYGAIIFLPRPPELISLACLPSANEVPSPIIVYPDPPISAEEERLFEAVAPNVQLRSFTEWLAGAVR